jgi:hypothetical protein
MTARRRDAIGVLLTRHLRHDDLRATGRSFVRDGRQLGRRLGRCAWTLDDHGRGNVWLSRLFGRRRSYALARKGHEHEHGDQQTYCCRSTAHWGAVVAAALGFLSLIVMIMYTTPKPANTRSNTAIRIGLDLSSMLGSNLAAIRRGV